MIPSEYPKGCNGRKNFLDPFIVLLIAISLHLFTACSSISDRIDRKGLVYRHNVSFQMPDSTNIPQVGNGEIAFGIDVTGLQTLYGNTMSQWGWHSYPLPEGKSITDFKMAEFDIHGRKVSYPVKSEGQETMYWWLRENPHRLNLGKFSFLIDGDPITPGRITEIHQTLNLWEGIIYTRYKLDGIPVGVITACHPEHDAILVEVKSPLIRENRLSVQIAFPYGNHLITGADWNAVDKHTTICSKQGNEAVFKRNLDKDTYEASLKWYQTASLKETEKHTYALHPGGESKILQFTCVFAPENVSQISPDFPQGFREVKAHWEQFWTGGGAIDLSGSTDERWKELERRVVLSQYLLAVNEAGSLPPQESGLLLNSGWYGKFHLEMHWWHGAHYQLWSRWDLFERSLGWYSEIIPVSQGIATRQGYSGARWPKMIGPDGRFGPSGTGPWLIWQQPHPIFYAEQNYRLDPSGQTLEKWKEVVFETAEFMASYAYYNKEKGCYELGPYLINAAENNHRTMHETLNPAFELAYWKYGLQIACIWRERMGLPANNQWLETLQGLAALPVVDSVYVMYENVPDMWTEFNRSHIDVIGPGAFIPNQFVDLEVLGHTIDKVWKEWDMESTWGWDFPWLAMAAARSGKPDMAVDALLMDSRKNRYNRCGINGGGPAATYFPGNGGLLYAVAMMAAGWDGAPELHAPGFPDDGTWNVKYEGLNRAQ